MPVTAIRSGPSSRALGAGHAWYYVILLCVLYAFSFVDRLILSLIADPVSKDLGISDTQMGVLLGTGFALVYCAVGLPMAQWIDRSVRVRYIVASGVASWSASTMLSAFAHSFETMLICRAGIAMGEAVLGPAAMAVITRLFEPETRRRPTAVYAAVNSVMKSGALILGAAAINLAVILHGLGLQLPVWRLTLIIVGVPGLLVVVLLFFTIKDPPIRDEPLKDISATRDFVQYLRANWDFWVPFYAGVGIGNMISYGAVSWIPTILVRGFHVDAAVAGYAYGSAALAAAIGGVFFWAYVTRFFEGRRAAGPVTGLACAGALATVTAIASVATTSPVMYIVLAMFIALGTSALIVLMMLTIQMVGPKRMVARLLAINILISNLIGLAAGPLLIAVVAGIWKDDPFALGYGLAAVGAVAGTISVSCLMLAHRRYDGLLALRREEHDADIAQREQLANRQGR